MDKLKILIIDDEPVVCDGCQMILTDLGHYTESRQTGEEGLQAFFANEFDVVLLDLKLPDSEGMSLLEVFQERNPNVYVIVMTGYSTVKNAVKAMKIGAFDFIPKPFDEDQITVAINRVVENRRLVMENLSLKNQLFERYDFENIIGENPRILTIFDQIRKVAPTDSTVLLEGESGTGKELFARAIHAHSQRAPHEFLAIDCSTLSPGVLESELFGHVRGAFTGAVKDKPGLLETADKGTLMLDEIASLSPETQGKLLRFLESGEFKRVGANQIQKTATRIIAVTNRNLEKLVADNTFREDLFYRLSVFPIFLPPLRERKDDIPRLAHYFLRRFSQKTGKPIDGFTEEAMDLLVNQEWPGNIRELKNVIERLVIISDRRFLDILYLMDNLHVKRSAGEKTVPDTLSELKAIKQQILSENFGQVEKAFIIKALRESGGNISRAASAVGMQRSNFHALMNKHQIQNANP